MPSLPPLPPTAPSWMASSSTLPTAALAVSQPPLPKGRMSHNPYTFDVLSRDTSTLTSQQHSQEEEHFELPAPQKQMPFQDEAQSPQSPWQVMNQQMPPHDHGAQGLSSGAAVAGDGAFSVPVFPPPRSNHSHSSGHPSYEEWEDDFLNVPPASYIVPSSSYSSGGSSAHSGAVRGLAAEGCTPSSTEEEIEHSQQRASLPVGEHSGFTSESSSITNDAASDVSSTTGKNDEPVRINDPAILTMSASSTFAQGSERHRNSIWHKPLDGKCEFIPLPPNLEPPAHWPPPSKRTVRGNGKTVRAFVGQVSYKTTPAEIALLVEVATGVAPLYVVQIRIGCFVLHYRCVEDTEPLLALHQTLLFDHGGVWAARDEESLKALKAQVSLVTDRSSKPTIVFPKDELPRQAVVTGIFQPKKSKAK